MNDRTSYRWRFRQYPALSFRPPQLIIPTADRWWQNLSTPPKAKPRVEEFPYLAWTPIPIVSPTGTQRGVPSILHGPVYRATVIYQDLANPLFFDQAPAENVTVDKWYEPLSERLVKSEPRAVEYTPACAYGPTPIVQTVDRWWQNLSTPPRAKARVEEFPAFTIAPQQPPVGDATLFDSVQTDGPVFSKSFIYRDVAESYHYPQAEVITVDKWFEPLSERLVKSKLRTAEFPAATYGATPIVNTADQWWQNLSTPPKAKPRVEEFPAFTYGAPPIVQTVDRWGPPLSTPPKAKQRAVEYQSFAYSYFVQPETVTVDKWFEPLSERSVKVKPRASEFPAITLGSRPIVNTPDQWWQNLSTPPKAKPRAVDFQSFTIAPQQPAQPGDATLFVSAQFESPTFTKSFIYRDLAESYHQQAPEIYVQAPNTEVFFKRVTQYQRLAYVPQDNITVPGWFRPLAEPYPFKRGQKTPYQQPFYFYPFPIPNEIVTLDKWYRPYVDPRKLRKDRVVEFRPFTFGQVPIVQTVDRWWQNLATPPKRKTRLPVHEQQALAFTATVPTVFADRWWVPFTQPKRDRLGQRYYEQQHFGFVKAAPFGETVIMSEWWVPFTQPKRNKFGQSAWEQRDYGSNIDPIPARVFAQGYIIC